MEPLPILILGGVFIFVALIIRWSFSRARGFLHNWAEENGYEIVSEEMRWFRKGPYFWKCSKNQVVFRITVSDSRGELREGWARCGSFWLGLLVEQVDVTWDSGSTVTAEQPKRERKIAPVSREFSLKSPTQWLWRTKFTREQVLQRTS